MVALLSRLFAKGANLKLRVNYRYNAAPLADGSILRVIVNGLPVKDVPLIKGQDFDERSRWILFPVTAMRPSSNTLLFDFVFKTPLRAGGYGEVHPNLDGEVLRSSSLDVRELVHWTTMPNLELFANAGFPFTRMAYLSETTVVLSAVPTPEQVGLCLLMMSHFGAQTGYPALRVTVTGPDGLVAKDCDYLVMGTIGQQPAFSELSASLPAILDGNGLHVREAEDMLAIMRTDWMQLKDLIKGVAPPAAIHGDADAMIEGIESPYSPNRSIVVVSLKDDSIAHPFASAFLASSQSSDISGALGILRGNRFSSFRIVGKTYHVGTASKFRAIRI